MPDLDLDLDDTRETIETALAFIRSGAPATDLARMPSVFLAVGAAQQLLARVGELEQAVATWRRSAEESSQYREILALRAEVSDLAATHQRLIDGIAAHMPDRYDYDEAVEAIIVGRFLPDLVAERDAMRPVVDAAEALYIAEGDPTDLKAFDAVVETYLTNRTEAGDA